MVVAVVAVVVVVWATAIRQTNWSKPSRHAQTNGRGHASVADQSEGKQMDQQDDHGWVSASVGSIYRLVPRRARLRFVSPDIEQVLAICGGRAPGGDLRAQFVQCSLAGAVRLLQVVLQKS